MEEEDYLEDLASTILNGEEKTDGQGLTDDELVGLVKIEMSAVETDSWSLLSQQRISSTLQYEHAINYDHKATEGLSNVVMNFTNPCVDTLSTYMSKIFCSDKETVVFTPSSPQMTQVAEQAMTMVNNVLHKQNNGYKVLSRCFRDAAINKNSVIKITWEDKKESFEEEWDNITPEQLQLIISQKEANGYECEITQQVEEETVEIVPTIDPVSGEQIEIENVSTNMSAIIKCTYSKGMPKVECVPPEEFLINEGATDINDTHTTRFVAHRRLLYNSDIQSMFPDVDVSDLAADNRLEFDYEKQSRHYFDGTYESFTTDNGEEPTQLKEVVESWVRADRSGDGIAGWRHVFTCGSTLLMDEEWFGSLPFASFTYFPITHKFYGLSAYDKLRDYERSATALLRSEVDSSVLRNTTRIIADPRYMNMRDLQTVKNGIIRSKPGFEPKNVLPVPHSPPQSKMESIIAIIRQQVISEIGIDPVSGQISTDVEKSGNDAAKTSMVVDNASAKIESYAREFADNTLREVIWQILMLLVSHSNDDSVKRLAESATPGQPFLLGSGDLIHILDKSDLTAKVGLGHMTGQQKIASSQALLQMIQAFAQDPNAPLAIPASAKAKLLYQSGMGWGMDNPEAIFGNMDEINAETAKIETQKQQQLQLQQQQAQAQQTQANAAQQSAQSQFQLAQAEQQFRHNIDMMKAQAEIELNKAKALDLDAKVDKTHAETDKLDLETTLAASTPIDGVNVNL